ncbi:hypothetical protein HID58_044688 [Brassica napus]|uniref:RING-type domain-containing protein n=1 Tax=Brassica napus TaxID=3708 RepID=A0ABQ8BLQ0_BRANA|nr:hypothetical protein HID58_044688 [Brassica napus]
MSNSGEAKTHEELESQASEEESQSQQREVAESSNKGKLDEDSEEVVRAEDYDALPLACPICKAPFLDPVVTNCDHYFCNLCARKHHESNTTCFVCKNPTLGVFKPSVEIKIAKVLEKESQSQHGEMAESSNKGKLDEDSEEVARAEDDDALPLACPFCELPFLDPVVTTCDHYFCNLCARKHHKKDPTCFVCKNPTLGVFKPSVEIKNKIAKMRENMKPQENKAAMFDFEEYTSQYIRNYHQGGPLLLRVLHMVTHKLPGRISTGQTQSFYNLCQI